MGGADGVWHDCLSFPQVNSRSPCPLPAERLPVPRFAHNRYPETVEMMTYPRSPKILLGGIAHLARLIDKIRLRHAGHIQNYNYLTVGFDKYLIDFLQIDPKAFEQRVLAGGSDDELLAWVKTHSRALSDQDIAQWSQGLLTSGPKDDATRQRYQGRLQEVATQRGVPVASLPPASTWVDAIELDEGRM
ncbi:MAG: DUF5069 domain-containing protein [Nitrospira sp. CR2.1]|nr:DUF5069 domain-containing protein [Nitrospira sp. CR2.1]